MRKITSAVLPASDEHLNVTIIYCLSCYDYSSVLLNIFRHLKSSLVAPYQRFGHQTAGDFRTAINFIIPY